MMRTRVLFVLLILAAGPAFAPAPFPRPPRGRDDPHAIDMKRFQGTWKVVSFDIVQADGTLNRLSDWGTTGTTRVRVQEDKWTYLRDQGGNWGDYLMDVDANQKPAAINWYTGQQKEKPGMLGIIRRDGDHVTILYYAATDPAQRPRTFDNPPANWWILKLRKGG